MGELPPGVPSWPPKVFLPRGKFYTKNWHVCSLWQGEIVRGENDPRIAEGDTLSLKMLWLDYDKLAEKLMKEAAAIGAQAMADALRREMCSFLDTAYEAGRMRVDDVTMSQLNRSVADLYTTKNRMALETTTLQPDGIRHIQTANPAMLTAKSRAIAAKAANHQSAAGSGIAEKKKSKLTKKKELERKKRAEADKKKEAAKAAVLGQGNAKPVPPTTIQTATETTAREECGSGTGAQ